MPKALPPLLGVLVHVLVLAVLVLVDVLRLLLLSVYQPVLVLGHVLLASGFDLVLAVGDHRSWRGGDLDGLSVGLVRGGVSCCVLLEGLEGGILMDLVLEEEILVVGWLVLIFFFSSPMRDVVLVVVVEVDFDFGLSFVSSSIRSFRRLRRLLRNLALGLSRLIFLSWAGVVARRVCGYAFYGAVVPLIDGVEISPCGVGVFRGVSGFRDLRVFDGVYESRG